MTKKMSETNGFSAKEDSNRVCLPLRRLEMALNQIIDIEIPFHLKNLEQHKHNIEMLGSKREWNQLLKEEISASQTVRQLKADLIKLEDLSQHVMQYNEHKLNTNVLRIKSEVCEAVQHFNELHKDLSNPLLHLNENNQQNNDYIESVHKSDEMNDNLQIRTQISDQKSALISWENLKKELSDLNAVFNTIASTVMGQREQLNRIEDNISDTHENVLVGNQHLSKASALKSAFVPMTAALVGGAVFGPIGMLAGFKSGIVSAVGASIISYSGMKFIQKKSITKINEEMDSISLKEDANKDKLQ